MPRNFGLRRNDLGDDWRSFWDEPAGEPAARWPFYVIGAAVALIIGVGFFA